MSRRLAAALSAGAAFLALVTVAPVLTSPAVAASVAASAAASSSGYCRGSTGVTVVADFTALGGGVEIRCDPSATTSTTGLSALHGAGFSTTPDLHDGSGFVCRINDQPPSSKDPCINTPPPSAYWSYWYARNGGSWTYSSTGAASRQVAVGGFEGWRFGDGSARPGASPTRPPTPVFHLGPAASATAKPRATASHHPSASPSASATPKTKPSATTADPVPTPVGTSTTAVAQAGGVVSGADPPSGGSPLPFVLGAIAVVLVLGGAGAVVALRRRGAGGP